MENYYLKSLIKFPNFQTVKLLDLLKISNVQNIENYYLKSLVNFLPDNGPTLFCLFSKNIPYIVLTYKTINNSELEYNYILPSKYFYKETGRLIWGKKNQWFYEGKDNCENLEKIFKEYYFTVHKKQI